MSKSGQKFVARNRAPRVQIEYDVELYGAEKKVELPFVVGVMADLSGAPSEKLPAIADRKFLEIDVDNFDERMKAMRPRAAFTVENTLTGNGNLAVDLEFGSIEDFAPAAIARKVAPLKALLEARTQLAHLVTYMDGKTGAEELIAKVIADPAVLAGLTGPKDQSPDQSSDDRDASQAEVLESLRKTAPDDAAPHSGSDVETVFAPLRKEGVGIGDEAPDGVGPVLSSLRDMAVLDEGPGAASERHGFVPDNSAWNEANALSEAEGDDFSLDEFAAASDAGDEHFDPDGLIEETGAVKEVLDGLEGHEIGEVEGSVEPDVAEFDLDADIDLEALLGETGTGPDGLEVHEGGEADEDVDLDLSGFDEDLDPAAEESSLPDFDMDPTESGEAEDGPDDLDDLAALEEDRPQEPDPFGKLTVERPGDLDAPRTKFRIALLGDFSGRASRGELEIGDALAARKPVKFDVDTLDDVIGRFSTTLVLPLGDGGTGVEVALSGIDDLHPDELFENVPVFDELASMRDRVARGDKQAIADLRDWASSSEAGSHKRKRAKGAQVPAGCKLSDFQNLIGDIKGTMAQPSPASELIGHIVAPHIEAAPDPDVDELLAVLDVALSDAMRTILHHPDFQAVESTWRSLEFLARRVETGARLEIVLYDVSAEEWAADLAAQEELSESGLFRMLAEEPRLDDAQGPLSAVFGLYTLEETPPHAELMARMAKIAAWMNASFVAAVSPQFLETRKEDRHPLVARTWDALRALPEAAHAGLIAPRFLLRLPYGRKTDPVEPFDFEEFTLRSGLKGMLWANPVILSAVLMAETASRGGKTMRLGEIMSIGDIPLHTMTDQYGDQIALPCTERLLNTRTMADVVTRGFMSVLSIKGRNEVRQGSFQALGAGALAGPWELAPGAGTTAAGSASVTLGSASGAAGATSVSPETSKPKDTSSSSADAADLDGPGDGDDGDLDALLSGLGDDADGDEGSGDADDLDALLSGFGDDAEGNDDSGGDDDLDPELAALLEDL
ncbi:type VI secretion system contractile sheath small subunit [Roseibium sp. RKSG952]|uniref:type VI secretion system contractile sheath small subunit n=1 Tax=Roseibium sp. RKSG952 TaxID=2529384 RepID=UPI0012BD3EF7|nr:type VI secretion system contractile sheath small subunit [Roseibium sp. RKSG952]MTH98013.1 type VI secretion system contractile sheath small subunit [Roseibium sp. RKSG952]